MFARRPDFWLVSLITVSAAVVSVIDFVVIYVRTKALRKSLADASEQTRLALRPIEVATVGIVVLAIVASWLAVTLNRFPINWVTVPKTGLVVFVLVLTFVVPTVISTAICYSVASTAKH